MPNPPRHLADVCEQMLAVIPDEAATFRYDIRNVMESAQFCPPEAQRIHWIRAAEAFQAQFGFEPTEGWGKVVYDIWMDL